MINNIYTKLFNITNEDKSLLEILIKHSKKHNCKKNQVLIREGNIQETLYIVVGGLFRGYSFDENNIEHTEFFSFNAGDVLLGSYSFQSDKPSFVTIESITNSQYLEISIYFLMNLQKEYTILQNFFLNLTLQYLDMHRMHWKIIGLPAKDRYKYFCLFYPELVDKNIGKYIASFLGLTPEHLCRIKKR